MNVRELRKLVEKTCEITFGKKSFRGVHYIKVVTENAIPTEIWLETFDGMQKQIYIYIEKCLTDMPEEGVNGKKIVEIDCCTFNVSLYEII